MFGGPGAWLHTYVGGITNAPGSIGYEHVLFAPPAQLIRQALEEFSSSHPATQSPAVQEPGAPLRWGSATRETGRGTFALFWSLNRTRTMADLTCAAGTEGTNNSVHCPGGTIKTIEFADFGTPSGDCTHGFGRGNCTTENLTDIVTRVCVGQKNCTIECRDDNGPSSHGPPFKGCVVTTLSSTKVFSMPSHCRHVKKTVVLQVTCDGSEHGLAADLRIRSSLPANSIATTAVPLFGADVDKVMVSENGILLWHNGAYMPGVKGVTRAVASGDVILVSHGSGAYDFRRW